MASEQAQLYIFKRLLKGENVYFERIGEDTCAVSDGVRVYVFAAGQIKFDPNECIHLGTLSPTFADAADNPRYTPADAIREHKNKIIRLMESPGRPDVWIEDSFAKEYIYHNFTYAGGKKPVCVLDDYGNPTAAIMPIDMDGTLRDRKEEQ